MPIVNSSVTQNSDLTARFNEAKPVPGSSRKRRLLAIYVDYLVFTAFYQPIAWMVSSAAPLSNWVVALAIFVALRSVAWGLRVVLPGNWALGIGPRSTMTLDQHISGRERWWTVAAGTLLVLEGSKNLVRWTEGLPIEPVLGSATPQWMATVAITTLGAASVLAGLLILRTRRVGAVIGAGVLGAELLAAIVHREGFRDWAAKAAVARRTLQGIAVRDGEIEMMQTLSTSVLPAAMVIGLIWLLAIAVCFRATKTG